MLVGFLRNYKNPPQIAKYIAINCHYFNIDLIYIRPQDIDIENVTVKGKMFINNKWKNVVRPLPKFIDISPYCFKHTKILNFLREHTLLSDNGLNRLSKEQLQTKLKVDPNFTHLVIPTEKMDRFDYIDMYLEKFDKAVLKPVKSERGRGIYILEKLSDKQVRIGHQKTESIYTDKKMENFYEQNIKDKGYIIQKFIHSRTVQNDPFDCRIHVEKNIKGKWTLAKMYIRIGIGQKVISNVNQGGGISSPKSFLKANYGEEWESIYYKLINIAESLPYKIEELRNQELMVLGFDVGIDKEGNTYLFEVNTAPAVSALKAEVALFRAQYYKYILSNM